MKKYRMGRISGGWNYRGYCVYRKVKGQAGCLWQMADDGGDEWAFFFSTLDEFRGAADRWCAENESRIEAGWKILQAARKGAKP